MHFSCSDWFTQSRLSAHIPLFDLLWQLIALKVAKLNFFFAGKRNFSLNKAKKKKEKTFFGEFGSIPMLEVCEKQEMFL